MWVDTAPTCRAPFPRTGMLPSYHPVALDHRIPQYEHSKRRPTTAGSSDPGGSRTHASHHVDSRSSCRRSSGPLLGVRDGVAALELEAGCRETCRPGLDDVASRDY